MTGRDANRKGVVGWELDRLGLGQCLGVRRFGWTGWVFLATVLELLGSKLLLAGGLSRGQCWIR
ncbi:MAG: hypothetical protein KatS3mg110_1029 [Pirellulaceae bacterium]|nr:MAG: hypothetical protein KatS3mg110_1029 [Pirellulaceae bacterium]